MKDGDISEWGKTAEVGRRQLLKIWDVNFEVAKVLNEINISTPYPLKVLIKDKNNGGKICTMSLLYEDLFGFFIDSEFLGVGIDDKRMLVKTKDFKKIMKKHIKEFEDDNHKFKLKGVNLEREEITDRIKEKVLKLNDYGFENYEILVYDEILDYRVEENFFDKVAKLKSGKDGFYR